MSDDKVDFELATRNEKTLRSDLNRGARRRGLDHVLQAAAGFGKHGGQVLQDVRGLPLDRGSMMRKERIRASFGRDSGPVITGDLAGRKDEPPHPDALAVVRQRARRCR